MTFLDFFAGIGGFRRGMELAGHKCLGFCEFDKYATASYTSMHLCNDDDRKYLATLPFRQRQKEILDEKYRHGEWYSADIRGVACGSLPRADCWCVGFPCQDISVAGKQRGFDGERSSLFFEVMRLLKGTGGGEIDPNGCSSRMLKICLLFQQDLISRGFSVNWKTWGTLSNGGCSTRKILESPRIENACTLLDFMETDSPEIRWISPETAEKLMSG